MNSFLVHHKTADPGVAKGSPAEQAPLRGPKEGGRRLRRPWSYPNQTSPVPIGDRSGVMRRGWFNVWSALAIALTLLGASSLRAQFVYVTNEGDSTVSGYTIDPSTGALTSIAGSPFPADAGPFSGPSSMAVDPSGKFAYVANSGLGTV